MQAVAVADAAHIPLADVSVHMVMTSPPYDAFRAYHGGPKVDLSALGDEIARVLVHGGVAAVVLQDQTRDGHKTLTTFRPTWCATCGRQPTSWRRY